MSDLSEFLREARSEVESAQFERDAAAGRMSEAEYGSRIRLVGCPDAPLAVYVAFRTVEGWVEYAANASSAPPLIQDFPPAGTMACEGQ